MRAGLPADVRRELTRLAELVSATGSPPLGPGTAGPAEPDQPLAVMAAHLYSHWYLQPPPSATGSPRTPAGREDLGAVLRAAHAGATRFTAGWLVQAVLADASCVVARGGEQRHVLLGGYVNLQRPGVPVAPGEEVAVTRVIDRVDHETRWWGCQSEQGEPVPPLGRHYLHPRLAAAPVVVHELTAALLDAEHAWALKCPIDAAGFRRPDALVVYAPCAATPQVRGVLERLARNLPQHLLPHLPPLTQPLGDLVRFAEDPGGEDSFGSRLCRALAPGALELASGAAPGRDPVPILVAALSAAGYDPARPWRVPHDG